MEPAGSIRDTVDRALAGLAEGLGPGPAAELVAGLRTEFAEPLRVAVAGRIKAGKSTLVNALLRQRVAPTDVGECTRFVTWYRYGLPERLEIVPVTGQRDRRALRPDGSLPPELDVDPASVHHLDVYLSNDQLRRMTVIDTPGLASAVEGRSEATRDLLALDRDSRAAVSQADVLVLVMALDARLGDDEVLGGFEAQFDGLRRTALNAAAVLSRIDLLDAPAPQIPARAAEVAAAVADRLTTPVAAVVPVATLLAETIECGLLTDDDVAALVELAGLDEHEQARLLRTTDRFLALESSVPTS
ncbi:MAG TPA: dynamin family protein, partial [Acidimicrobiia bacterium]|nr:dynamin family protein [Acidimicrobiia bacterium]